MASELKVTTISEKDSGTGVTIDGTQLKDTKVYTDQVDPKSGTDLTLGTSGDTVTIPSGVTFTQSGTMNASAITAGTLAEARGGTGASSYLPALSWQSVQTSTPFTAVAGNGYPINTTSGAITMNLPAGTVGDEIAVIDYAGTFDTNALTIAANGSEKIKGSTEDATLETERQAATIVYVDSTQGWVVVSAAPDPGLIQPSFITATGGTITTVDTDYKVHTFNSTGTFEVTSAGNSAGSNTVDYLVVGGGGGGGSQVSVPSGGAGGGGAGGMRYSYPNPATGGTAVTATTYPVSIGAGGGAGSPGSPGKGTDGTLASALSISSAGGGAGSGDPSSANGNPGGSGGGGTYNAGPGGSGNTPPVSPPQGNNGGAGTPSGIGGGSGGGHTAAGTTPSSTPGADAGGAGTALTIPGASTSYAGGGGGGAFQLTGGTGGAGGGGQGGNAPPGAVANGVAGTANTGGGGGGGGASPSPGGAGGKGVVVIRYKFQ